MDLWIRTQDKTKLSKISNVQYYYKSNSYGVRGEGGNHYVGTYYDNLDILGEYRTKERAIEVLDSIDKCMSNAVNNGLNVAYYVMPES